MSKTIKMPLPVETAGGKALQVAEHDPATTVESIQESFTILFSQTDMVKIIKNFANGVLHMQFIGNGCVANMQIYEVRSEDAFEEYVPHFAQTVNMKGGIR